MRKIVFCFLLIFLFGCSKQAIVDVEATFVPTATATQTATNTMTPTDTPENTPTFAPSNTPEPTKTPSPTSTPVPTATERVVLLPNPDGRLNCPNSVALMYHHVIGDADGGAKETTDLNSFAKVMSYLAENEYYFPTTVEFADDIADGVCDHKYAIVIVDDTWNDPEGMGLLKVLSDLGGNKNIPGSPKLWLAVVTRMVGQYKSNGESMDGWVHLKDQMNTGLICIISHSQTHPAELANPTDYYSEENAPVLALIAGEIGPSRQDILNFLRVEPHFFVYPGGNVTATGNLAYNNYSGAFTVTPGGLNGAFPNLLPRINGGYGCGGVEENSACVIEKIKSFEND